MESKSKSKANTKTGGRTTFGTLAVSMFWMIVASGILLALPFDAANPYLSVSTLLVANPWASFIRNLHFWSSQFFLVLSLIHLYDHFHYREKIGLKPGMAFRLSLGVFIIFLAMITGFLLKGDADSEHARQILQTLAERLPGAGNLLAFSLLGNEGSFQIIYVHHIATFTIFIAVVMVEHSKKYWPAATEFIVSVAVVSLVSILFSAPLHDNLNPTVKGPWYFVGFQEILHWMKHAEWSLLHFLLVTILVYLSNSARGKVYFFSKRILLVFAGFYLLLTITGMFFRGENWQWMFPWSKGYTYSVLHSFKTSPVSRNEVSNDSLQNNSAVIQGRRESCMVCHSSTHGFTDSHRPEAIGCFSCHGGNPFTGNKKQAHKNMNLIPGNLATARQSCGTTSCHPEITERVPTGLMSTLSGMISVDRFVFGEQDNPDVLTDVHQLGKTPADEHLRNLCVRCHLGNPKSEPGPVTEFSRGGGCLACHLNYTEEALQEQAEKPGEIHHHHPSVSLNVTNMHCFGCHSRSGRISTNYEGWHETTLARDEMPDSVNYRLVENSRVFIKKEEDVHHRLGLECIDCHHSYELMGDGKHYAHEEEQQDVQCSDCHFSGTPKTVAAENLDNEPALIAALRFGEIAGKKFLVTQKHERALINTFVAGDSVYLVLKNGKKQMAMKPPAAVCQRDEVHAGLSCSACHSAWTPTCIGCHNAYDHNEPGYNMVKNREQKGSWVEFVGEYKAQYPTLGVRKNGDKTEIIPVIPGMILTIDLQSFSKEQHDSLVFRRLFAPAAPHTTSKKGRDCKSCHNNPVALGFGEGELIYETASGKGVWKFEPMYENDVNDKLPADAWTAFLQTHVGTVSTRTNVFPFTKEQQQNILTVGACLTCHDENSEIMQESLSGFDRLLQRKSGKCVLPEWQ